MRNLILVLVAFLIGPMALAAQDSPPKLKVCLLSGSEEYDSDTTLAAFQKDLEAKYRRRRASCSRPEARTSCRAWKRSTDVTSRSSSRAG